MYIYIYICIYTYIYIYIGVAGFEEVIHFIKNNVSGLVATCSLYNILAHSKLAWTASFYMPPSWVLKRERKCRQLVLNGPWNAFTDDMLTSLKSLGFPVQFAAIAQTSPASIIRTALNTASNFDDCRGIIRAALVSDDRVLTPFRLDWIDSSICVVADGLLRRFANSTSEPISSGTFTQRMIQEILFPPASDVL